ncbi:DEAD/DEAH box helicase [Aliikangiella sp. G2MR2-5]|uniref:DEAD/DEAH box helicase n=1 Tax=Aliikangiella sp. G2MR2-5 TaxID=2788943 RepID=UPI0018AADBE8|nr:DEAD/DEAH box helicase [Aliikangiella sp. G2MR2-5]
MLTKPLAYKGPNDHLSQLFSLDLLFAGIKLLFDDMLMDWRCIKAEDKVQGVFLYEEKLVKAQLSWPLAKGHAENFCNCNTFEKSSVLEANIQDCVHLAALAIESKVQIDRLPFSLKQQESYINERDYFNRWRSNQHYDPFPNMARHRVVYVLKKENENTTLSVHKAYLTQQHEYQIKSPLDLSLNVSDKLPKFVSLTDQEILLELKKVWQQKTDILLSENNLLLDDRVKHSILPKIAKTGRLFWKACHRKPLDSRLCVSASDNWVNIGTKLWISPSESYLYVEQAYTRKQLELLKRLSVSSGSKDLVIPKIEVTSHQFFPAWRKGAIFDFDIARVKFAVGEDDFSLEEIEHLLGTRDDHASENLYSDVAAYLYQLYYLESVQACFEPPVVAELSVADRYLKGDFSHWLPLLRGLKQEGWEITFAAGFRFNQKKADDWYAKVAMEQPNISGESKSQDWFEFEVGVKIDGTPINILPMIVEMLHSGQLDLSGSEESVLLKLPNDSIVSIARERIESIVSTLLELREVRTLKKEKLRLSTSKLNLIQQIESLIGARTNWSDAQHLQDKAKALSHSEGLTKPKIPQSVRAQLREYQKYGVSWLQFLTKNNIGGVLADDMGLGKTLQTLVHVQIEKASGRMTTPAMVVAPTSLIGNWITEAAKFTPELNCMRWSGSQRHQNLERLKDSDLIVTSYGILLRDAALLNQLSLYMLILDEAQAIKNSSSKISKIAFSMSSKHRLCITGTPMENHLGELWSLFHFLMPGLLGEKAIFKRLFQNPVEKENDRQVQKQLSLRVSPFMLRRTKDKVAADLPSKTEIAEFIELTESQADLYESVRISMLEEVQKAINEHAGKGNQLVIGNALLRLRQICCHPKLVKFAKDKEYESSKLTWLRTVLPELVDTGSRVLIFSSFTSMLDIIEKELTEMDLAFLKLTGKSKERSRLIEQFQSGTIPVFLISLKAGGAGLNLTAADTVIHFDPWWNPAAESQASDRAHRIGQTKPVFVYRLIAKGTVEEKIHQLQQHKTELARELYQTNDLIQSIDKADWETLLSPLVID